MLWIFAALAVIGWILDNTILTVVGCVLSILCLITVATLMAIEWRRA